MAYWVLTDSERARQPRSLKPLFRSLARWLAFFVALAICAWLAGIWTISRIPDQIRAQQLVQCRTHLRDIGELARAFEATNGTLPRAASSAFLMELLQGNPSSELDLPWRRYGCPGRWMDDCPELDALYESPLEHFGYAFADNADGSLRFGDASRALAACGNLCEPNHEDVTCVLMADGSIAELSLSKLKKHGEVPADANRVVVGAGSPIAVLRTLKH